MTDEPDNVINLASVRPDFRAPISSYSVTIERYAVNEAPAFTVRGLGNDVTKMDIRQLCKDMLECALTFSSEARGAGGQSTAVAFASIWTDGTVSTVADTHLFLSRERRAWLDKAIALLPVSFADLLDDDLGPMPVPNSSDLG